MQRREFNRLLAAGMGAGLLGQFHVAHGKLVDGNTQLTLPEAFDEIDHFHITHRLRDGAAFDFPKPSEQRDLVIVGGGLSGMITAHRLPDVDSLILEKESVVGGNSRRHKANGIAYPLGAITSQGAEAPFTSYFNELSVPFQKVEGVEIAYYVKGKRVLDPFGEGVDELPFNAEVKKQFAQLKQMLTGYLDEKNGIFFPRASNIKEIRDLDKITLYQYFQQKRYKAELVQFLDHLLSTRIGCDGQFVSAWMGLYILSRAVSDVYTLPGGHGAISEILERTLQVRENAEIRTGFTTLRVENKPNESVWISGLGDDGAIKTIEARAAVMAVPKFYASRVIPDLEKDRKSLINKYQYNAYLVAQVELSRVISDSFETINDGLFSRIMLRPDWLPNNRNSNGKSHLTVYIPFPGSDGRRTLYASDVKSYAQQILKDIETVFPGGAAAVEKMTLHRWGHPMIQPTPGIDAEMEKLIAPHGSTFFSHSDSSGITGLYSAVWAGMQASNDVLLHLMD